MWKSADVDVAYGLSPGARIETYAKLAEKLEMVSTAGSEITGRHYTHVRMENDWFGNC